MNAHAARGTAAVVVTVLGWALVYFFIAHAWALSTAHAGSVGTTGFIGLEILRIAPTLTYFLVVGLVIGSLLGPAAGARWTALGAAVSMVIEALLEHQIFYGGVDPLAIVVLAVDYLLPVLFATAGALITRSWQKPIGGTVAT